MSKNLVLIVIGVIVMAVLATLGTLAGVGVLAADTALATGLPVVTAVLGALLALLDPSPPKTPPVA